MTQYNKTTLKTFFETGDVPVGQDFANLIDSCVNNQETAVQAIAGPLNPTELITARISAGSGLFTSDLSAANIYADNIRASAFRNNNSIFNLTGIVSALGSTQATAAPLIYTINIGSGVTDGQTTGFLLPSNKQGLVQYVIGGAASANLWPPSGGRINALASNAAFPLQATTQYTILHTESSGYFVK